MSNILFIGAGTMGNPMITNLTKKQHKVFVYDARPEAAREICELTGAIQVSDPRDAIAIEYLILMLPNSAIVEEVLGSVEDANSLINALPSRATIIDMGSSDPISTKKMCLAANSVDLDFFDAPVSGGIRKAISAELTIMVGAESASKFQTVVEILKSMGTELIHVGPVGAGHAAKALNNMLSVICLVGSLEVIGAAKKFGINEDVMLSVINASTGRNQASEVKIAQQVFSRNWDVGFSLALTVKDLSTAQSIFASLALDSPVSNATAGVSQNALSFLDQMSHPDQSQIAQYIEHLGDFKYTI